MKLILGIVFAVLLIAHAHAGTITVQATNLPDTAAGDIWRYEYFLDGFAFQANDAFSILFDPALYGEIVAWGGGNPDWDSSLVIQPDPNLPSAGRFEPLALVNLSSLADNFFVEFVFLGSAPRAAQPFEIVRYDREFNPTIIETGVTVPVGQTVPEPGSLGLLLAGAAVLGWASRRNHA